MVEDVGEISPIPALFVREEVGVVLSVAVPEVPIAELATITQSYGWIVSIVPSSWMVSFVYFTVRSWEIPPEYSASW